MTAPTATRSSASRRDAACNAILDATTCIIADKGVDGFTISEVAQRAQINRALIYHYFKTRENLIFQAMGHVINRYPHTRPELGANAVEQNTRMHIEHPEIARLFFQMLLNGRPLPSLSRPLFDAIDDLERLKQERAPDMVFDPAFGVIVSVLAQVGWAVAREEIARHLQISLEEADARFIAVLSRIAERAIQRLSRGQ